jgi:hypothetical protein
MSLARCNSGSDRRVLVDAELRRKIDEILGPMYCPEDYICSGPNIEQYSFDCEDRFAVCLRPEVTNCTLAVPRKGTKECRCVLRQTLLEKLH